VITAPSLEVLRLLRLFSLRFEPTYQMLGYLLPCLEPSILFEQSLVERTWVCQ
jgi:hypothetical protein